MERIEHNIPEGYEARIEGNKVILEPKESEDERIRKILIHIVKGACNKYGIKYKGDEITEEKLLAYLEKQKEVKWSPSECEMGVLYKLCYVSNQITDEDDTELTRLYQDLKREYFNGHSFENMFPKEKQKEQMKEKFPPYVTGFKGHPDPAGTSDLEEAAEKYIQGSMCDLDDGPSTGLAKESFIAGAKWQKEQKPAEWSEEDETAFGDLMWCINQAAKSAKDENDMGNIWFAENWVKNRLKSLRPQPKQEWSEEDEKDMAHIIRILDDCYVYGTHDLSKTDRENLVNKLKSLRPSWKPSEEQMDALLNTLRPDDPYYPVLKSLYEQLK